jgi:hypothetical protein
MSQIYSRRPVADRGYDLACAVELIELFSAPNITVTSDEGLPLMRVLC